MDEAPATTARMKTLGARDATKIPRASSRIGRPCGREPFRPVLNEPGHDGVFLFSGAVGAEGIWGSIVFGNLIVELGGNCRAESGYSRIVPNRAGHLVCATRAPSDKLN